MSEDKFYFIGLYGHIESRDDFSATDDLDALEHAQTLCDLLEEVWQAEA